MQAFLLSAVGQDFQPPDRAEGVQPEQVKLLTCLKTPASPIHTRHIPKKACRDASLFAFCGGSGFPAPRQSGGRSAGASQIVDLLKNAGFTHPHAPHSKKACSNAGLFAFCRMEELPTRYSSNQLRYLSVLLTTKHYDNLLLLPCTTSPVRALILCRAI